MTTFIHKPEGLGSRVYGLIVYHPRPRIQAGFGCDGEVVVGGVEQVIKK